MLPSSALGELREQHDRLRELMDDCEQLADALDAGRGDFGAFARALTKLRLAFAAHNQTEEALLPSILRELDAFGDVRVDQMVADHVEEHRAFHGGLDGPPAQVRATLYRLRAHLAAEERAFLSARVIRDDLVNVEGTS